MTIRRIGITRSGIFIIVLSVMMASSACKEEESDVIDVSCLELKQLRAVTTNPSAVSMLFSVENCQGQPVPYGVLNTEDFEILEDNSEISSEAHREVIRGNGLRVFVTLLLDMSDSTKPNIGDVIAGAKSFTSELLVERGLNVSVGIQLFDGSAELLFYQRPISDATRLHSRLESLSEFQASDGGSTNLNGALLDAVTGLQQWQADYMLRNQGGTLTTGYIVLFTDGGDSAGRIDAGAAKVAVALAREADWTEGVLPTVQTFAVALRGEDYNPDALDFLIAGSDVEGDRSPFVVEATSSAELQTTFENIANRVAAQVESTFLLAYCSSKRTGVHTVSVGVKKSVSAEGNRLDFTFTADGFDGGCNEQFFRTACDDKECGGFNCGACDDEVGPCNATTLQCDNYCLMENSCNGEIITNPRGYEQICDFGTDIMQCDSQCVDTSSDPQNCGSCGVACVATNSFCQNSQCRCPDNQFECNGSCVALDTDTNCGVCGNVCPADVTCQAGVCLCAGGGISCFGTCIDPMNDAANCGGCSNDCGPDSTCTAGGCVCSSDRLLCDNRCVDTQTDSDHCGGCAESGGQACPTGEVCVAGSCLGSGVEIWRATVTDGALLALTVDAADNVIAAGYVNTASNGEESWIGVYDRNGALMWSDPTGLNPQNDRALDVAVGPSGAIYLAMRTYDAGLNGYATHIRKYVNQSAVWTQEVTSGPWGGSGWYTEMVVTTENGADLILVLVDDQYFQQSALVAMDADGNISSTQTYGEVMSFIDMHSSQGLILGRPGRTISTNQLLTSNYWSINWPTQCSSGDQDLGPLDVVVVGGVASGTDNSWIGVLSAAGTTNWQHTIDATGMAAINGVSSDLHGNVVVGGELDNQGTGTTKAWLSKYDSSGNSLWSNTYSDQGASTEGMVQRVTTDSSGRIIAGGRWNDADIWVGVFAP